MRCLAKQKRSYQKNTVVVPLFQLNSQISNANSDFLKDCGCVYLVLVNLAGDAVPAALVQCIGHLDLMWSTVDTLARAQGGIVLKLVHELRIQLGYVPLVIRANIVPIVCQ